MFVNVLIVTDSQHGLEIFRRGQSEEGRRASWAFIPLFLPACLPYLFLSFPGRAGLLAGSQTESGRMILLRRVGALFCKRSLKLYRPLWRKAEGTVGYNSCTVWLPRWREDVMWMGALRHEWNACVMCQICSKGENGSHFNCVYLFQSVTGNAAKLDKK